MHTPGPWTIHRGKKNDASGAPIEAEIRGHSGRYVVVRLGTMLHDQAESNATLIAEAPALAEALRDVLCYLRTAATDYEIKSIAGASVDDVLGKGWDTLNRAEGRTFDAVCENCGKGCEYDSDICLCPACEAASGQA